MRGSKKTDLRSGRAVQLAGHPPWVARPPVGDVETRRAQRPVGDRRGRSLVDPFYDLIIAATAGRPSREPCRPGVSATGGPRRGRKAYQTPNWRPGLRLGAPLDGLCGRLAHRYRYHQKQREISSRRAPASTAVLATGGAAFSSRGP